MLLWRLVLSFVVYLQPPSMWVVLRGELHFEHVCVGALFSDAPLYVDPPRHLQCVATRPVGCCGVSMNGMVRAFGSNLF